MTHTNATSTRTRKRRIVFLGILILGASAFFCQTEFPIGEKDVSSVAVPTAQQADLEKIVGSPVAETPGGWDIDIHADEGHEGHDHGAHDARDHGDHEGHDHGEHEDHEPGVVHLTEKSLENFGIETSEINEGDLTLTLDLYGWVRPRPQDVRIVRAPFPAIVAKVFAWPGQFVSGDDLLVAFVIPEQLDWVDSILSSENELARLDEMEGLLRREGHAKAVGLVGDLQVAAAELEKLRTELELMDQVGGGGISKREVGVKRGEVKAAQSKLEALRGMARTYGLSPDRIKAYEEGEKIGPEPDGAMPAEVRSQLDVLPFNRRKASITSEVAAAKLKILGATGPQLEGLQKHVLDPLKSSFTARSNAEALVTKVTVTPPTPVSTEDEIMRLVDYRIVYVELEVPEVDIADVVNRDSDAIFIRAEGLEDRILEGKVAYFDTEVLPKERMAHLVVEVENVEGMLLRDGMSVMAGIPLAEKSNVLAVPRPSVIDDGMEKVVFVEEASGDFRRIPVRTGVTTLTSVEIVEGLEPGKKVATAGVRPLLLALQKKEGRSEAGGHGHSH